MATITKLTIQLSMKKDYDNQYIEAEKFKCIPNTYIQN